MELLKLLSTNEIVAQAVSFLVLLFLLRAFAWKRLLGLLDERKEKIAGDFRRIEEAKQEAEALRLRYEAKWNEIEAEGKLKIQEVIAEGHRMADDIKKDAQVAAQEILEKAKADMRFEIVKAREALKDDVVDLVLKTTEYVIEEKLTPMDDKKIVEGFLDKLDKMP